MKQTFLFGALAAILILSSSTFADSIMCQKGVVNTGNFKTEVLDFCGKPLFITARESDRNVEVRNRRLLSGFLFFG